MSKILQLQKERLMQDLRAVIADSEALLQTSTQDAEESLDGTKSQIQERLNNAKLNLKQLHEQALQRAEALGQDADQYVHAHPWQAMGLAGGVGLLLGLLMVRR